MIYKFNWIGDLGAGTIFNDTFPNGRETFDPELKPVLTGITYDTINYDEDMDQYYITRDGSVTEMTQEEKDAALAACIAWNDPSADVESPLEDARIAKRTDIIVDYESLVNRIDTTATSHEMISWRKQEEEARAWDADNNASTPMIDILLVERDSAETKQELVTKIITNADAYLTLYAGYLGRRQKAMRLLDAATTINEIDAISF